MINCKFLNKKLLQTCELAYYVITKRCNSYLLIILILIMMCASSPTHHINVDVYTIPVTDHLLGYKYKQNERVVLLQFLVIAHATKN